MNTGFVAIVLHAHLPFVRHLAEEQALEERWLFEALSETYLPLLESWEQLRRAQVPFAFALTLSPTLLTMLTDDELNERYVQHLQKLIELAEKECRRTEHEPEQPLAKMYLQKFTRLLQQFEQYERNIIRPLAGLQDSGHLELLTCGATHGFLPVISQAAMQRAQIALAVQTHTRLVGRAPKGIWLPECGYVPGIEQVLADHGLAYFLVDSHAFAKTSDGAHNVYAPLFVGGANVYALARDPEAARQVWSSFVGYPGDPDYREYYRDIGFDLDWSYIQDYVHPDGIRVNTGIKYHRVTGIGAHKELYDPHLAMQKCEQHAEHFVQARLKKVQQLQRTTATPEGMPQPPLIVAPYDAELFGHWWYEGPQWLRQVACKMGEMASVRLITPSAYLEQFPQARRATLSMSSWGRGGYAEVWINESNDWVYPFLHRVEEQFVRLVGQHWLSGPDADTEAALQQMAREILLAESSDWAFMMTMGTTVDYAVRRVREHLQAANRIGMQIQARTVERAMIEERMAATPIFPHLDLSVFLEHTEGKGFYPEKRLRVLMLAWEFPPLTVGGLARHVYDLSRALASAGVEVHVITCHGIGTPEWEFVEGVQVHRVEAPLYSEEDFASFVEWTAVMNMRLAARGAEILQWLGPFDVLHAHDWLVTGSALWLSECGQMPLVTTIHATEFGRHHGLHNDLQRQIFAIEQQLALASDEVIVCSAYMKEELATVYQVPALRLHVLPNGVDLHALRMGTENEAEDESRRSQRPVLAEDDALTVFYVGRLVPEKGVQVLLEAAPAVLKQHPNTRFVIAGKGPMLQAFERQAQALALTQAVQFVGFVSDVERNLLFEQADVAVFPSLYEPFGIVALEAMGSGVPTIVSKTGGLAEIIEHQQDGWLVEPGDASALAETLCTVLGQPLLRAQVAANGRAKVERQFGWSAVAEGTERIYQQSKDQREKHPVGS